MQLLHLQKCFKLRRTSAADILTFGIARIKRTTLVFQFNTANMMIPFQTHTAAAYTRYGKQQFFIGTFTKLFSRHTLNKYKHTHPGTQRETYYCVYRFNDFRLHCTTNVLNIATKKHFNNIAIAIFKPLHNIMAALS